MKKVSVILPTYNEKENIRNLIDVIFKNMKDITTEIIVVDDNSPDKTWKIVKKISDKNKNVSLLRRRNKRGLASAISDGISLSRGNIVVMMDSDFSMPPEVVPKLVKKINNCDITLGSRYVKGGGDVRDSLIRVLSSKMINLVASIFLGYSIKDYTSAFLAVKREVFNNISILPAEYGDYCIGFLYKAKRQGFKIKEVPYRCISRRVGKTKTSANIFTFLRYGFIYFLKIFKLRFK